MAAQRKPTARKGEAAAALAESNGHKPHQVKVRDIEFMLPAEVPFAVILASRTMDRLDDDDQVGMTYAALDLAEAYIGDQIRKLHTLSANEGGDVVTELLEKCDELYGTDSGESSASPGS